MRQPKTVMTKCVPGTAPSTGHGFFGLKSFLLTLNDASENSFIRCDLWCVKGHLDIKNKSS